MSFYNNIYNIDKNMGYIKYILVKSTKVALRFLASPSNWNANNANSNVWNVYSTGDLNNNNPTTWRGVR